MLASVWWKWRRVISRCLTAAVELDHIFWKHPPLWLYQAFRAEPVKTSERIPLNGSIALSAKRWMKRAVWKPKKHISLSVDANYCIWVILWLAIAIGRRARHTDCGGILISSCLPASHTSTQTASPEVFIYSLFYVSDALLDLCRVFLHLTKKKHSHITSHSCIRSDSHT